jgi:tetratricopeptide (TPR) repeat protein
MDVSKNQKAAEIFRRGVEVSETTAYGLILKAQMEWALDNNKEAWKCADLAVKEDPTDARTFHFRAFMQSSLASGADDRSSQQVEIDDYNYIIKNLSSYHRLSIIHNNLGYVYYEMKEFEKANHHFDLSMSMCPHHAQTYYNKAVCVADTGDMELAATYCDRMIEINSEHSDAHALRGWIYISLGDIANGVQSYRRALDSQTVTDAYTVIVYTGGLVAIGQFDEVRVLLNQLIPRLTDKVLKIQHKINISSSEETRKYRRGKMKPYQSCLAICHRIQGEIDVLHGQFGSVQYHYDTFLRHSEGLDESLKKKWETPLLKFVTSVDMTSIGKPTIDIIQAYHQFRHEAVDPEQAFRALQMHVVSCRFEMNVSEQKYLIACIGHLVRPFRSLSYGKLFETIQRILTLVTRLVQLLSLYWEGDPTPSTMLEEFFVHWNVSDPGFVKIALRPHYLVNLFELSTRIGNGPALQMIIRAGTGDTPEDQLLIQALGQLARLQGIFGNEADPDVEEEEALAQLQEELDSNASDDD